MITIDYRPHRIMVTSEANSPVTLDFGFIPLYGQQRTFPVGPNFTTAVPRPKPLALAVSRVFDYSL